MGVKADHSAGPSPRPIDAVLARETAATEVRHWVRLTRRCNNRCLFCHDAERHDGSNVDTETLFAEIRAGRERGATRLLLSGGEPTIHPAFIELVEFGKRAGYGWVQVVTNGRMFAYDGFTQRAAAAGLSEATVSMHGHTAELHDRLVGVRGAFDQALRGLRNLLRRRFVVSVDVVVSRPNVRHLEDILRFFLAVGVREFDLLHLVPFGRGWNEHRDDLFYDPASERPYVLAALSIAARPDVHLWTNRWPAPLLEGAEPLIQDPQKIEDEVRGGFEGFCAWAKRGIAPDCRGERCPRCFLSHFCDTLEKTRARLAAGSFDVVAASADAALEIGPGARSAVERQTHAALRISAKTAGLASAALSALPRGGQADLEIDVPTPLSLSAGIAARTTRVVARTPADLDEALGLPRALVEIPLDRTTAGLARQAIARAPGRIALRSPGMALLSETVALALAPADLAALSALGAARAEDIPACLSGASAAEVAPTLDLGILDADGTIDVFAFVHAYVKGQCRTRSLRCAECVEVGRCPGAHVNYVRAHGFSWMRPLRGQNGAAR
jgi:molybdenum cofactor biosynthesis enzyme MoaA